MELNDWVLIVVFVALFSVLFGILVGYVSMVFRDYRVSKLEKEVERLGMVQNSAGGKIARQEKAERMQTAMVEVAAIMKNPEIQDKQGAVMQLAMKYPDLALELLRKGI